MVVHNVFIDVIEKGAEAAPAPAVEMMDASEDLMVRFFPTFRAERPFIYLIFDCSIGAVLFLGRMPV